MKIWNVLTLLSSSTSTGLHVFQNVAYYYMIVLFISGGCGGMGRGGGFGRWVGGGVIAFLILRYSLFVYMKWHSRTFVSVSRTSCETGAPADKCYSKAPVNSLSNQQLFSQAYQYVLYGERTIWEYLRKKLFQLLAAEL